MFKHLLNPEFINLLSKGVVLLLREISLKVIIFFVKKSNFQYVIFAIVSMIINGHTFILFKNILNDVKTKGKGEINMA